ncbi:uncharacterized protein LOC143198578 [Rhynchophorus ferrugineus]|uniref:uncharacterized protein LOC143198578 n=1 Tax=Rhynchophorus ferrugineus TaxID=354439 RepID=UPI003FCD5EC9
MFVIYDKIFRRILDAIRDDFELRKMRFEYDIAPNRWNYFADKLKQYQKIYPAFSLNYEYQIVGYGNFFFIIWHFILAIISQIFCMSYLVVLISGNADFNAEIFGEFIYCIGLIGFSYYICKKSSDITNLSNDLISYIYKYPITKLTLEEANLVESLLLVLHTHKPKMAIFDIFTVRKSIIPSVVGQVVTYGLVALQFNILDAYK